MADTETGADTTDAKESGGLLRRAVRRLTAEPQQLDDADMQKESESKGATAVDKCQMRKQVTVFGTIRSMTLRPRAGVPALEVELYDGTGTVTLVWLGRRVIAGLSPGRQLRAIGRIATVDDRRLMFNPRYDLRPL